jgi:hypothetical protein
MAAASLPPLDPKDHKAFMELQDKMIESHQGLKSIAAAMKYASDSRHPIVALDR